MKRLSILLSVAVLVIFIGTDAGAYTWYYYNGHYYTITQSNKTWEESESEAQSLGGDLVVINDQDEQDWLVATFGTNQPFWIGLRQLDNQPTVDSGWYWINGDPLTYVNWNSPSEPNDSFLSSSWMIEDNDENYGEMNVPGAAPKWNDIANDLTVDWTRDGIKNLGIIEIIAPVPSTIMLLGPWLLGLVGFNKYNKRRKTNYL
jgi:hypothetical protein